MSPLLILQLTDPASSGTILRQAVQLIHQGGVVVCATDTGYLLGVDGLNPEAIRKIYAIKGRSFDKPIHIVVSDLTMAKRVGAIDPQAEALFRRFLPGPLTLVVKKQPIVPEILVSGRDTVGLRIPENDFLLQLVQLVDTPLTATSANRSGLATPYTVEQVQQELGMALQYVNLIVDQGPTPHARPSTILDLTRQPPQILRSGPISAAQLADALGIQNLECP